MVKLPHAGSVLRTTQGETAYGFNSGKAVWLRHGMKKFIAAERREKVARGASRGNPDAIKAAPAGAVEDFIGCFLTLLPQLHSP